MKFLKTRQVNEMQDLLSWLRDRFENVAECTDERQSSRKRGQEDSWKPASPLCSPAPSQALH